jgi:hypothetical protein
MPFLGVTPNSVFAKQNNKKESGGGVNPKKKIEIDINDDAHELYGHLSRGIMDENGHNKQQRTLCLCEGKGKGRCPSNKADYFVRILRIPPGYSPMASAIHSCGRSNVRTFCEPLRTFQIHSIGSIRFIRPLLDSFDHY